MKITINEIKELVKEAIAKDEYDNNIRDAEAALNFLKNALEPEDPRKKQVETAYKIVSRLAKGIV